MSPPRIEVGGVWMVVLGVGRAMKVKDELVGGKDESAEGAFDALCP